MFGPGFVVLLFVTFQAGERRTDCVTLIDVMLLYTCMCLR